MPTPDERAKAQALYLKEVHTQAEKIYDRDKERLPIDPQGRVLLQVNLDPDAWKKIYHELDINPGELANLLGHPVTKATTVSYDIQTGSNENLDSVFQKQLGANLTTVLQGKKNPGSVNTADWSKINMTKDKIIIHYKNLAKGRIISLHQETHFHAHLIGRMVKTAVDRAETEATFGDTDKLIQKGLDNALVNLNKKVQALEANALVVAYKQVSKKEPFDEEAFQKVLNKELDTARKKILPDIAKEVRVELIKATGIQFDEKITKHLTKKLAEATSASVNDTVHISKGTGAISFIGASSHTSHDQQLGSDYVADRTMYSHHLDEEGEVHPLAHRQQIRVPALAVKVLHQYTKKLLDQDEKNKKIVAGGPPSEVNLDDRINKISKEKFLSEPEIKQIQNEYTLMQRQINQGTKEKPISRDAAFNAVIVTDTANKIYHLQSKYNLGDIDRGPIPKAFVYNLYTSINRTVEGLSTLPHSAEWFDEKNNKQTQSAIHILQASHEYNRKDNNAPLCFVQNVPVNGWGHPIDIAPSNPSIVNEAALMGQLAVLHTVYDVLSEDDQTKVQTIFKEYKKFLETSGTSFYDYVAQEQSMETLGLLEAIKQPEPTPLKTSDAQSPSIGLENHRSEFVVNAQHALAALFKAKAFTDLDNGFTYQALSVFVENASIGGCKSANERAQAVNGRVAILDFVSLNKETRDVLLDKYLSNTKATELKTTANALENAIKEYNLPNITKNMNTLYGSLNLEGFQALISFVDQGGHAKLSTKGVLPDTNSAEPVHTNVKNASKWQCHKGLTDNVLAEFSGIQKFSWSKEIKAALRPVAAAIGVTGIGLGIAAAVGITAAFPPAGLILAAAAGVALIAYTLFKVLPKYWASLEATTQTRFKAIQENNIQLVEDAQKVLDQEHQEVLSKKQGELKELLHKIKSTEPDNNKDSPEDHSIEGSVRPT